MHRIVSVCPSVCMLLYERTYVQRRRRVVVIIVARGPAFWAAEEAGDAKGGIVEPPSRRVLTFAAEHLTTSLLVVLGACR